MFVRQATMENQFVKQYPELMRGKKLMYVHGFGSSAQSGTVQMLRTLMPNATVVARDIPLHPEEGLQMLKAMAAEEQPDLIIGTSMGGMYTEMLTGFDRILVNPAFEMGDTMSKFTGKQVFQNPREDGVQEFIVTKGLIKEYQEMTTHNFEHAADPEERTRVIGLFGDNDPATTCRRSTRRQVRADWRRLTSSTCASWRSKQTRTKRISVSLDTIKQFLLRTA